MQQLLDLPPGAYPPGELNGGLRVLYSQRQRMAKPWASGSVTMRYSSLNRLLKDSTMPFCHGEPGSM